MVLIQGGGTLLAQCKNTLWMILETEESSSQSPSPSQTPEGETETGGFSDSQGSGNVSPTLADMQRAKAHMNAVSNIEEYNYESEVCLACLPQGNGSSEGHTSISIAKPLPPPKRSGSEDYIYDVCGSECDRFRGDGMDHISEIEDMDDDGSIEGKGPLDDVDLLQGAGIIPPPMEPLSPRNTCKVKTGEAGCKCKIVFKKDKGKQIFS